MPEEDSILCESCNKWFHFICIGITGKENFLKEGNDIDYICSLCDPQLNQTLMTIHETNTDQSVRYRGRGRGRRHLSTQMQSSSISNSTSTSVASQNETANSGTSQKVTRSGRTVKKPAKLTS